jgi:RimJ/RimL family protein N-acetyltransferase
MGDWWPIQRLRLTTPRLELRVPSYDDLLALGDVAAAGIHDPATMPFDTPWTDVSPAERARATIQWHWRAVGTEMRAAVLHLGFAGLRARSATSAAFTDNPASNGVSRRLGYELDGTDTRERRGEAAVQNRYRLTRDQWFAHATVPVEIHGLGNDVLELLGALERPD